jgi:NAD(P)-dependent dehydrogenase (short-subunit alcohol dehydrogenase family)
VLFVQTNHLGHFVIATRAAAQHLKMVAQGQRKQPLRVVFVTSLAARPGSIHWDDLQVCTRLHIETDQQNLFVQHRDTVSAGSSAGNVACPGYSTLMNRLNGEPPKQR